MADSKVTNKLRTKESSEVKFTDDELQSLAGLQTSYQEKSAVLGQLRVQRILADQQMEALEEAEDSAIEDYKAVQQEESRSPNTQGNPTEIKESPTDKLKILNPEDTVDFKIDF